MSIHSVLCLCLLSFVIDEAKSQSTAPSMFFPLILNPTTVDLTNCNGSKFDLIFILDSSGSVGEDNFKIMKSFMKAVVQNLNIGPYGSKIGLITFSRYPFIRIHLDDYTDKDALMKAIDAVPYIAGITETHRALYLLRDEGFKGSRPDVPNIAIVVTDGKSFHTNKTTAAAAELQAQGVVMFGIGIGGDVNANELSSIASDPDSEYVYTVTDFASLATIVRSLSQRVCGGNTETDKALDLLRLEGWQGDRKDAPNIAIVVTDGLSTYPRLTMIAANRLLKTGATVFAVGIGQDIISVNELNIIASDPKNEFVYSVATISDLSSIENYLARALCQEAPFINTTVNATKSECNRTVADIVFVLDSSGSLGITNFEIVKQFVINIVTFLDIGEDYTKVGVITYNSYPTRRITLDSFTNKLDLINAIKRIRYYSGNTETDKALDLLRIMGWQGDRKDAPNIAIVVTDGLSTNPGLTMIAADRLLKTGATVFAIGTGQEINDIHELNTIASNPDNEFVFFVDSFSDLFSIENNFARAMCQVSLMTTTKRTTPTTPISAAWTTLSTMKPTRTLAPSNYTVQYTTPLVVVFPSTTSATAGTAASVVPKNCFDAISNCDEYGNDVCFDYKPWAMAHCQLHCGFCQGPATPPEPCINRISNCVEYGTKICTSVSLTQWTKHNCPKYCGFCGGGPIPTDPSTLQTIPAPTRASVCRNEINNCEEYGGKDMCHQPAYEAWAKSHCAEFCEYCSNYKHYKGQTLSNNVTCPDWNLPIECKLKQTNGACCPMPECPQGYKLYAKLPLYASGGPIPTDPSTLQTTPAPTRVCRNDINNCEEYGGKDMCHQPVYEAWAKSHCAEFCEYCSNYKHYKGQTLSNNVTCPDWNLPIECNLKQTNGACCPMPECLQGYSLYAKSPFEF